MSDDAKDKLLVQAILNLRQNLTTIDKRDLWDLVELAYALHEISIGKAAELLGLPIEVTQRALAKPPTRDGAFTREETCDWLRKVGLAGTGSYCLDNDEEIDRVVEMVAARLADRFWIFDKEPA